MIRIYRPLLTEMDCISTAIEFEQQLLKGGDDLDARYNAGYIDAVAATMAAQDPYLEDCGDIRLMREIYFTQHGMLNQTASYTNRRHAYLAYIRQAAASMTLGVPQ